MKKFSFLIFFIVSFIFTENSFISAKAIETIPSVKYEEIASGYDDFKYNEYWSYPFLWAIDRKIITGYSDTKHPDTKKMGNWINPNGNLTEYHMLTILLRYFKEDELKQEIVATKNNRTAVYNLAEKYDLTVDGKLYQQKNADKIVTRGTLAIALATFYSGERKDLNESVQLMYDKGLATGYADATGKYSKTIASYGKDDKLRRAHLVSLVKKYDELIMNKGAISTEEFEIEFETDYVNHKTFVIHPKTSQKFAYNLSDFNFGGTIQYIDDSIYGIKSNTIYFEEGGSEERHEIVILDGGNNNPILTLDNECIQNFVTDGTFLYLVITDCNEKQSFKIVRYNSNGTVPKIIWESEGNEEFTIFETVYFYNKNIYFSYRKGSYNQGKHKLFVNKISIEDFDVENIVNMVTEWYFTVQFENGKMKMESGQYDKEYYFYDLTEKKLITTEYPKIDGYKTVKFYNLRDNELILGYRSPNYFLNVNRPENFIVVSYNLDTKEIKRIANGVPSEYIEATDYYLDFLLNDGTIKRMYY